VEKKIARQMLISGNEAIAFRYKIAVLKEEKCGSPA